MLFDYLHRVVCSSSVLLKYVSLCSLYVLLFMLQAHLNYLRSLHDLLGRNLNPTSSSSTSTAASWESLASCVTESGKALNDVIKKMRREVSL